jgi:hypothetical protein
VHDHAGFLLHRMSLVSGEGTPEVEVAVVVSEVHEWLQSQPDDLNSVSPFYSASATYTSICSQHLKFLICGYLRICHFELP